MNWIKLGAFFAALGVAAGAVGAHMLERHFAEEYKAMQPKTVAGYRIPASYKYLGDYKTGVRYHMYHALGLIALGLVSLRAKSRAFEIAGWLFVLGILLFSGSIYVLTILGPSFLGVAWGLIAAAGGTAMILGWLAFAAGACSCGPATTESHQLN